MPGNTAVAEPPKKSKGRPGPKPDPSRLRSTLVTVRCRPEWRDWVERLATHKGTTSADVIDDALMRYGRDEGFPEAAPKR